MFTSLILHFYFTYTSLVLHLYFTYTSLVLRFYFTSSLIEFDFWQLYVLGFNGKKRKLDIVRLCRVKHTVGVRRPIFADGGTVIILGGFANFEFCLDFIKLARIW